MSNKIEGFKIYDKTPNTISKGTLYIKTVHVNVLNDDKERLIRVYLPSNYEFDNPQKRFPVMYMMDGKNLFDDHTSFVGEWHVDETIEKYVELNKKGMIVVGIDSAMNGTDRCLEMLIESEKYDYKDELKPFKGMKGYGSILAKYIIEELKPMIDNTFYTLKDKDNTGVGGSSMGGLYSFYMAMKYHDKIGFSLCFSPAFLLYKSKHFKEQINQKINDNKKYGKFFFFCGGVGLEKDILPLTNFTVKQLERKGFDENQIRYIYDSTAVHNERPWTFYFDVALDYWGILK